MDISLSFSDPLIVEEEDVVKSIQIAERIMN
ncbi:hypothetical protein ATZ99_07010 [Thermovenabulum gondwanense]|uniref:Uncharacterized protein n=1 Tax=Thermovenabulum gondwanense TaxID=520767 RepID=A0A161PY09_9FIRM|nr:hypothetical protein ATZ99_07010 [Thermovenabulum gondwanense]